MVFGRFFDVHGGPFVELQREINDLLDSVAGKHLGLGRGILTRPFPAVNVYEDRQAVIVECELPGVDPSTIDVSTTGDVLTIKGERPALSPDESTRVHIQERRYCSFNRAVMLPADVQSDKAEAKYEHGVLRIKLPKAPEAQPRQVAINVEK